MAYAHVVLDIATRALTGAYDYVIPEDLAGEVEVGVTVLVTFSRRLAVGYVVAVTERPVAQVPLEKILPVRQVLAPAAFDEGAARVASWMAREYACPPCEALRPFLAPGQLVKVRREAAGEPWELVCKRSGPVDVRWVRLAEREEPYQPRRNASRQRAVLAALAEGAVRMAELTATIPGAEQTVDVICDSAIMRDAVVSLAAGENGETVVNPLEITFTLTSGDVSAVSEALDKRAATHPDDGKDLVPSVAALFGMKK